jgi:hypothetical protein
MSRYKPYYDLNRDEILAKKREHYKEHKEELYAYKQQYKDIMNERKREKVTCDTCSITLSRGSVWKHKKICSCVGVTVCCSIVDEYVGETESE